MKIRNLIVLLTISTGFLSCSEENKTLDNSFFGYEYYPLELGSYWIYRVQENFITNNGNAVQENSYFIREEITGNFVSPAGDTIYTLQRSRSDRMDGGFTTTDVWTAELNDKAAQRTEENLRFTKMIFPFQVGTTWQGNLFDELTTISVADVNVWVYKDWGDYEVTARGIELDVEGVNYNDVATVQQAKFQSDIELRDAVEYYAAGVGLIRKEMTILDTQCPCPGQTWLEKAEAGFTLVQTLVEHN